MMSARIAKLRQPSLQMTVADTSPLNYLILIEAIDLMLRLYGRIVIPVEMLNELEDDRAHRVQRVLGYKVG